MIDTSLAVALLSLSFAIAVVGLFIIVNQMPDDAKE